MPDALWWRRLARYAARRCVGTICRSTSSPSIPRWGSWSWLSHDEGASCSRPSGPASDALVGRPKTGAVALSASERCADRCVSFTRMRPRWILHVETNLGLRPSGVERLGEVLLKLGLAERRGARNAGGLRAPAFGDRRDPVLGARNVPAVAALAVEQADRVGEILDEGGFPVV